MKRLLNALGFQAGWWACVTSVDQDGHLPALLFCAALAAAHLRFCEAPHKEIRLAALALAMGIVTDSLLQHAGVIAFRGMAWAPLSPFWLWALWILLAFTLHSSMAFLSQSPWWLAAGLGAAFGPLSYLAGARLGAAVLDTTAAHLLTLACVWALAMPVLVGAHQRVYRMGRHDRSNE